MVRKEQLAILGLVQNGVKVLLVCQNTFQTVSAASGRYRLRSTGSAAYILLLLGALFRPTFMSLHEMTQNENDSRMYFLIVLITDYCWRLVPYKSRVD